MKSPREGPHTRARGREGETIAERWLVDRGLQIVGRNVRNHGGEIDLIAIEPGAEAHSDEGDTLCFVEVKSRTSDRYGTAVEAVPPRKQRRLARAASLYLAREPWSGPCRFDVLALDREEDGWEVAWVRDAFRLG